MCVVAFALGWVAAAVQLLTAQASFAQTRDPVLVVHEFLAARAMVDMVHASGVVADVLDVHDANGEHRYDREQTDRWLQDFGDT